MACIYLATVEGSVDLNIVALDRLLGSSFDPEYGSVVPLILVDVVERQLRLAHQALKPPGSTPLPPCHPCRRATALSSFGAVAVAGRSWGPVGVMS